MQEKDNKPKDHRDDDVKGQVHEEDGVMNDHPGIEKVRGHDEGHSKVDQRLAPMDGLHRLQRSIRQFSVRRSIGKFVTDVGQDSDSADSFESINDVESDSDYSGSFTDVPSGVMINVDNANQNANPSELFPNYNVLNSVVDIAGVDTGSESDYSTSLNDSVPRSRPIAIPTDNINQNASSMSEFITPMNLPDVVLATKPKSGPMRWSLLRHRKQSQVKEKTECGLSGRQTAGGTDKKENRNKQQRLRTRHNAGQTLPSSTQQHQQQYQKDTTRLRNKSSSSPYPRKHVQNLGTASTPERTPRHHQRMTTRMDDATTANFCTRLIECWIQFLSHTCLPWCCSFLLWPLLFALLGGSGFMTIYLTLAYHESLAYRWVKASAIAIIISNIIVPPIIGIVLTVFSCLCRKPASLSTTSLQFETTHKPMFTQTRKNGHQGTQHGSKLLSQQKLKTVLESMTGVGSKLKVLLHMICIGITLFVVYSRHEHYGFYWNQMVKDMFISGKMLGTTSFSKVSMLFRDVGL